MMKKIVQVVALMKMKKNQVGHPEILKKINKWE
jgi:hypothetical protein